MASKARRSTPTGGRAWQRMLSGRRLDLLDPSPLDIEIEDIAHGLSRLARWNGQTSGQWAFSVAQHCLLVEDIVGRLKPTAEGAWRLAALLHDASEYVIGDLISPFKAAVGLDYRDFEARLQRAVHIRFGLPAILPAASAKLVKRAEQPAAKKPAGWVPVARVDADLPPKQPATRWEFKSVGDRCWYKVTSSRENLPVRGSNGIWRWRSSSTNRLYSTEAGTLREKPVGLLSTLFDAMRGDCTSGSTQTPSPQS